MTRNKLMSQSLLNSLGVLAYILAVSWLLLNGEKLFGREPSFWTPVALLLLFVLSATITGALVLGQPIWLYLGGKKAEAIKLFAFTVGWLFVITIITFVFILVVK